jgi:hypothetical protein
MMKAMKWLALSFVVGCGSTAEGGATADPCSKTDRGDGTAIVTCGTSKELVCTDPACVGIVDVTITGSDVTSVNLAGLTTVKSLSIWENAALVSVRLPDLRTATFRRSLACCGPSGFVIRGEAALTTIELPSLTTVEGDLAIGGLNVTTFSLPALTTVGGELVLSATTSLTTFNLPVLTSVGHLSVNAALTSFSLPALTTVSGYLGVMGNPSLTSFSLPVLTSVGIMMNVGGNTALTSFSLPMLTTVGQGLWVNDNTALTSFSLPALTTVGGDLWVSNDTALTTFSVPALNWILGNLTVQSNSALPECRALAFKDHLIAVHGLTGDWTISGNDTFETCPP